VLQRAAVNEPHARIEGVVYPLEERGRIPHAVAPRDGDASRRAVRRLPRSLATGDVRVDDHDVEQPDVGVGTPASVVEPPPLVAWRFNRMTPTSDLAKTFFLICVAVKFSAGADREPLNSSVCMFMNPSS